jgi:hypothetical protein
MATMALDLWSQRIGCTVRVAFRLFNEAAEAQIAKSITTAPALRQGADCMMKQIGSPGQPDFRRVWTIQPPGSAPITSGPSASSATVVGGVGDTSGFEDATPHIAPNPASTGVSPLGGNGPQVTGTGDDVNVILTDLFPRKVKLKLNSHRVADECEVELDIRQFPFPADGSLIRSIMVEVRRGLISPDDWARAMAEGAIDETGRPLSVPLAQTADEQPDFVGFVDLQKVSFGASGSLVTLPCRAFDGILADEPVQGRSIASHLPADQAIAEFLASIPSMVGMTVTWFGPSAPPVSLEKVVPKVKLSAKGKPLRVRAQTEHDHCLDALTTFCTLGGIVPRFRGYTLELAPIRTLDQYDAGQIRRMVLGHNIEELEFSHKLTAQKARACEVRSYNPDTGRMLAARYPVDPNRNGSVDPGVDLFAPPSGPLQLPPGAGSADIAAPLVFVVTGITDPGRLRDIAQAYFEECSRQDVEGHITTKDIATIEGRDQGIPDLLFLRVGDPLAIEIAPSVEQSSGALIQRLGTMTLPESTRLLESMGYAPSVASSIATQILRVGRPLVYRVHEISFEWSHNGATQTEIQIQNYVEVIDKELRLNKPSGGNRAKLWMRDAPITYGDEWRAIELDMLAGDLTPLDAALAQASAAQRYRSLAGPDPADDGGNLAPGKIAL